MEPSSSGRASNHPATAGSCSEHPVKIRSACTAEAAEECRRGRASGLLCGAQSLRCGGERLCGAWPASCMPCVSGSRAQCHAGASPLERRAGPRLLRKDCRMTGLIVDELPGVSAVEAANPHRGNELWIEVPQVHAVFDARFGFQGPPMRRHSEQLQSVATVGVDGSVIRTAPQWQEPSCIFCRQGARDGLRAGGHSEASLPFTWRAKFSRMACQPVRCCSSE